MVARVRARQKQTAFGLSRRTQLSTGAQHQQPGGSNITFEETCSDTVGEYYEDNHFSLLRQDKKVVLMNGDVSASGNRYEYEDWMPFICRSNTSHIAVSLPSNASAMATLMARTNPSRPHVSLPTYYGELATSIPLIKAIGARQFSPATRREKFLFASRDGASRWIQWNFGLAPLISDLKKLMNLEAAVFKRTQELKRLESAGGLYSRSTLSEETKQDDSSGLLCSETWTALRYKRIKVTQVRRWGTIRWKPQGRPKYREPVEMREYVRSVLLGLNLNSITETAWELLPWSWLIDWGFGVQDFLESRNNAVPAYASSACIMTSRRTLDFIDRADTTPGVSGGTSTSVLVTKDRYIGAPFLNVNLPFLTGKQLSILGSLAVVRLPKGVTRSL